MLIPEHFIKKSPAKFYEHPTNGLVAAASDTGARTDVVLTQRVLLLYFINNAKNYA